eukprot:m.131977 g.131977  ORF g.131977 m.131977 type:complete len:751 (+) comp14798_c0_seq5:88-2340(+)
MATTAIPDLLVAKIALDMLAAKEEMTACAASGHVLVLGTVTGFVFVCSLDGLFLAAKKIHENAVEHIVVDGSLLATADIHGRVAMWNWKAGGEPSFVWTPNPQPLLGLLPILNESGVVDGVYLAVREGNLVRRTPGSYYGLTDIVLGSQPCSPLLAWDRFVFYASNSSLHVLNTHTASICARFPPPMDTTAVPVVAVGTHLLAVAWAEEIVVARLQDFSTNSELCPLARGTAASPVLGLAVVGDAVVSSHYSPSATHAASLQLWRMEGKSLVALSLAPASTAIGHDLQSTIHTKHVQTGPASTHIGNDDESDGGCGYVHASGPGPSRESLWRNASQNRTATLIRQQRIQLPGETSPSADAYNLCACAVLSVCNTHCFVWTARSLACIRLIRTSEQVALLVHTRAFVAATHCVSTAPRCGPAAIEIADMHAAALWRQGRTAEAMTEWGENVLPWAPAAYWSEFVKALLKANRLDLIVKWLPFNDRGKVPARIYEQLLLSPLNAGRLPRFLSRVAKWPVFYSVDTICTAAASRLRHESFDFIALLSGAAVHAPVLPCALLLAAAFKLFEFCNRFFEGLQVLLLLDLFTERAALASVTVDQTDFDDEAHAAAFRAVMQTLSQVVLNDYCSQHDLASLLQQVHADQAPGPATPLTAGPTPQGTAHLPRRSLSPIPRAMAALDDSDLGPLSSDEDMMDRPDPVTVPCLLGQPCPHDALLAVDFAVWRACVRRRGLLATRLRERCPALALSLDGCL